MEDKPRTPDEPKTLKPLLSKPITMLPPAESPRVVKKYQVERSVLSGFDSDRW